MKRRDEGDAARSRGVMAAETSGTSSVAVTVRSDEASKLADRRHKKIIFLCLALVSIIINLDGGAVLLEMILDCSELSRS